MINKTKEIYSAKNTLVDFFLPKLLLYARRKFFQILKKILIIIKIL